jgi:hypothetical protein
LHPNGSYEFLGNFGPNYSPGSTSSYYSAASSFGHPYSEGGYPQSPLGANNSPGFHSSFEELCLPPRQLFGPPEQFPSQSPEPDYHSRLPPESGLTPYFDLHSPVREYPSRFVSSSQLEFVQGSSSQIQHSDVFGDLGVPLEGQRQQDCASSFLETEQDDVQRDEDNTEDPKVFKSQVSTPAGLAASEKKRKSPQKWVCTICNQGFTRKHSHTGEFNYLPSVSYRLMV